jgi:ABC-type phosphate transport system substrate-binding protein
MKLLATDNSYKLMLLVVRRSFVVCFVLLALLSGPYGHADDGALAIISNSKGAPAEMSISELKTVFKGERQRWSDGTKVVIALMKTTTTSGSTTAQKLYGMSSQELNRYWLGLVFQGKAKAPKFFSSESDLKDYVTATPGAIGIIGLTSLEDGKSILIDGNKSF